MATLGTFANFIPSAINTLERLLVWAVITLKNTARNSKVQIVKNGDFLNCIVSDVVEDAQGQPWFFCQVYVPYDTAWETIIQKAWLHAKEMTVGDVITAPYKTN